MNQSNEKRLSFYCVWKTWLCPAPPAPTTLQLYLAASNFDCPTFFSHQVGVNTSHRSKKLSTSTASATCHSRLWVTISSGTLFWIMLFRILMPGIKGTVQLRFQTSFLVYILTPLAIQFAKGVELGWCRFEPTVLVFLGQQVLPETITGTNWISPDEGISYYNSSLLDQMKVQTNETKYMLFLLRINF